MKAILVSKRFNPGHISHMEANAKLLEGNGFDVQFCVHGKFLSFPDCAMKDRKSRLVSWLTLRKGDLFIIWFPSISVIFNLLVVKMFTKATTVYIYHEPFLMHATIFF